MLGTYAHVLEMLVFDPKIQHFRHILPCLPCVPQKPWLYAVVITYLFTTETK